MTNHNEFVKVFAVGIGLAELIKNSEPAEIDSLAAIITATRDNLNSAKRRGFITDEGAKHAFYEFLLSLDIYERRELILGLYLEPLRMKKRPLKKDALYTLIWWFGFQLDLHSEHKKTGADPGPETAFIDDLISRRGGYWDALGDYLTSEGICEANEGYTAIELKKQYTRLKASSFDDTCRQRFFTYYSVSMPFTYSLEARRTFFANDILKLYPL